MVVVCPLFRWLAKLGRLDSLLLHAGAAPRAYVLQTTCRDWPSRRGVVACHQMGAAGSLAQLQLLGCAEIDVKKEKVLESAQLMVVLLGAFSK